MELIVDGEDGTDSSMELMMELTELTVKIGANDADG